MFLLLLLQFLLLVVFFCLCFCCFYCSFGTRTLTILVTRSNLETVFARRNSNYLFSLYVEWFLRHFFLVHCRKCFVFTNERYFLVVHALFGVKHLTSPVQPGSFLFSETKKLSPVSVNHLIHKSIIFSQTISYRKLDKLSSINQLPLFNKTPAMHRDMFRLQKRWFVFKHPPPP